MVFVVTALALLLLAVPLAFDVNTRIRNDKRSELARVAALAAADISINPKLGTDPIELPPQPSSVIAVGVYSATGHRVAGIGPTLLDRQLGSIYSPARGGPFGNESHLRPKPGLSDIAGGRRVV